jgi:hypothetical protein
MKVVTVAFPAVARAIDQGAHNGDAEPTDRALFCRSVQIGPGMGERIEGRPVVDEIDRQPATPATERDGDSGRLKSHPLAVCNDVGEKLFEDDEEPRPFVFGEPAIASELLGKGFESDELGSLAAQDDRSFHRGLMPCGSRRQRRASGVRSLGVLATFAKPVQTKVQDLRCKTLRPRGCRFRRNDGVEP